MSPHPRDHAVLYYSRDGHTDRLAHLLADRLDADIFRIVTRSYQTGTVGYIHAGFDSLTGRLPTIAPVQSLTKYASVSLGAPIWTSSPAAPLRAYLAQRPTLPDVVGMFVSCGDPSPPDKVFAIARKMLRHPFVATMAIPQTLADKARTARIDACCDAITAAAGMVRSA